MSLNYHLRVLRATVLTEFKSIFTNLIDPIPFVFYRLAKPLFRLWIIVLMYYAVSDIGIVSNFNFIQFVVLGNVANAYVSNILWGTGMSLTRERDDKRLKLVYISPVNRFVWMLGKTIVEIFDTTVNVIILILFGIFVFNMKTWGTPNWGLFFISLIITLVSLYSIAYMLSALVLMERHGEFLANMLWPIFTLLCGVNYPITILPDWVQTISRMIPITYGIDAIRRSIMQSGEVGVIWEDLIMLLAFGMFFIIISIMLFRILEYMARRRALIDIMV